MAASSLSLKVDEGDIEWLRERDIPQLVSLVIEQLVAAKPKDHLSFVAQIVQEEVRKAATLASASAAAVGVGVVGGGAPPAPPKKLFPQVVIVVCFLFVVSVRHQRLPE